MLYRFIDHLGTFRIIDPQRQKLYFPLTDSEGRLLSAISPSLSGDIKRDNDHFLSVPASIEDLRSSPLCRREFFIKSGKKVIRLSRPAKDILEAGFLYQKLIKVTGGLEIEILNFIPFDLPVEVMRVKVRNISRRAIWVEPTSFIPLYGRSEKNLRDHRHVSSLLNRVKLDQYGIFLKPSMVFDEKGHKLNRTVYYCLGFEGRRISPQGQYPTLDTFFGEGDIFSPDAVFKSVPPEKRNRKEFDGKETCAAFRFRERLLAPGSAGEYFLFLGIEEDEARIKRIFASLDSPRKVENSLSRTREYWQKYLSALKVDLGDRDKNGWLAWVKFQPTLRKLFGCSFLPHFDYGKGGRGWRDLWQDALTLLLTEPEKARRIITGSFAGVRLDGSNATIIGKDNVFLADRNRIHRVWMDHGVWPYLTVRQYLNRTADFQILLEKQTYFRDHQIKRAGGLDRDFCQEDFLQRGKDNKIYKGTILEHILVQNLVQFFNVGEHNIVRLEGADWNDGLDMAGEKGESVAFSFMYAHNLASLCDILRGLKKHCSRVSLLKELTLLLDSASRPIDYDDHKAKQKLLAGYFEQVIHARGSRTEVSLDTIILDLERKSRHMAGWLSRKEWLKEGFFNGYYDNLGRKVEGKRSGRSIRMMLTSQVFALMSGVATSEQTKLVWKAIRKHLFDNKLGGFRLNTDLEDPYPELGRAFGFAYGDKENGAFFSHMNVMLANALYKRKAVKEARAVLDSLFKMAVDEKAGIGPLLPEYFNAQGKGLYLYLTGSASWYIYTLFEEVLGIKFELGEIILEPELLRQDFSSRQIKIEFSVGRKKVKLVYLLQGNPGKDKLLALKDACFNGRRVAFESGFCRIKKDSLRSDHNSLVLNLG